MGKTRVMIVDDQRLARQYFELVVASAGDRYEVVHLVESAVFADTYVLRGGVDLVLMDVLMTDGSSSFEAAEGEEVIVRASEKVTEFSRSSGWNLQALPEFSRQGGGKDKRE